MKWKRWMAIGCSHGNKADAAALKFVHEFRQKWNPERRIHLGDVGDYAAFRAGAGGTRDEAEELDPDLHAATRLIERFEPTDVLIGNHDVRIWKAAQHQNAIVAKAAAAMRDEFLASCAKVKANVVDHYDINKSWIELGDTKFLHGWMFADLSGLRDHAEHFGRCVIAHLHKPGIVRGRRSDHPSAYCVGTLANIPAMDYANTRRATASWGHGLCYGEYSDTACIVHLCEQTEGSPWRMPI